MIKTQNQIILGDSAVSPKILNNSSYMNLYNMKIHSPTLDSVKMVEAAIKKHSQEYGKYQLWKHLPKKMMYQTFQEILKYLEESGKILIDPSDGIVMWTYDPEHVKELISKGLIIR